MYELDDILDALEGDLFEEKPVGLDEFVESKDYLGLKPLSYYQKKLVLASTQIYRLDTLISLYGETAGRQRYAETFREIIFILGKGSGKDHCSVIACAYIVYLLLCLKNPAEYYGYDEGNSFDILNIAVNADQAKRVFFNNLVRRIKNSPWFEGRYAAKSDGNPLTQNEINFDKNINIYSGHSEREAFEGYNVFFVVLDEISAFAEESPSGLESAKTASAVYKMYSQSVTSRYPDFGKTVLLSWPRYKGDFISTRYSDVIAEKETTVKSYTFRLNQDLPDGIEGNEFTIEWEEDEILRYKLDGIFALRRPSWEVNPTKKIEDYKQAFFEDPMDSMGRFACQPADAIAGFFRDHDKIERCFRFENGVDEQGMTQPFFKPKDADTEYFIHVDLAKKHDRCAVAISHVDGWERREFAGKMGESRPVVVVDAVRYWTPTKDKTVDFADVREYIVNLRRAGFNIRRCTFDRWRSDDMIEYLESIGIRSDLLSVDIKHYTDLQMLVIEQRVKGPEIDILWRELKQLRIMNNGKIDHPRSGSKDLADAVCGSTYNSIKFAGGGEGEEIIVKNSDDVREDARDREERLAKMRESGVIVAPKADRQKAPQDLQDYLDQWVAL